MIALLLAVAFSWDAVTNAFPPVEGYRIYYGPTSGQQTVFVEAGNNTTGQVTGLPAGSQNYFVVRAYNSVGESGPSNEVVWLEPMPSPTPEPTPVPTPTPTPSPAPTPTPEPSPTPEHGQITAQLLGRTGEDVVGHHALGANGNLDVHIRIFGLDGIVSRIRITSGGGVWETPRNAQGNWIVALQDGDAFIDFWKNLTSYLVVVTYNDGVIRSATTTTAPTPTPTPTPAPTPQPRKLIVSSEREYPPGTQVLISAPPAPPGYVFERWTGDTQILSNFLNPETTATIPSSLDVSVTAIYSTDN